MPQEQYPSSDNPLATTTSIRSFSQEGRSKPMPKHAILRHYALVIRDRSILILFFCVICTSSTYIINLYLPPIYQATTMIKIGTVSASDTNQTQEVENNATVLVSSSTVLQSAARSLIPPVTLNQLEQTTSSSVVSQTQLLIIQCRATSALQATKIANSVAHSYIQVQQAKEMSSLQTLLQALTQQIQSTRQSLDSAQQRLDTLKAEAATTQNISQQQSLLDTNQSSYKQLLTMYSQLQIQQLQVPDMLHIIQPAIATEQPISPPIRLNTLLAAGISLVMLCLLVICADWWDNSIKTAEDITALSGLEPLGQLPFLRSLQDNAQLLDFAEENLDALRDAVAMMGINFQILYKGQHALLCTSLHKQAGTTLIASQLATTLAHSGMRVLLIDAHFKRPALHTIFNLPNAYGLSNSLNDFMAQPTSYTSDWLAQWKTYVPNLWLLPSGPTHDRYQIQIATPHLIQLKERLLEQPSLNVHAPLPQLIDIIIFDAPPLEEGTLAQRLTAITDASILIIKSHQDRPDKLVKASHMLQHLETPILGVAINGYKARYRSYFYHAQKLYADREFEQNRTPATIMPQSRRAEEASVSALTHQADTKVTQFSFDQALPETPQPWRRSELAIQAVQPKFSLPVANSDHTQRGNSLLHASTTVTQKNSQQAAQGKSTLQLPIVKTERQALSEEEAIEDPITSLKLPKVEKPSAQNPGWRQNKRNINQFKVPYEQEECHESREQLT